MTSPQLRLLVLSDPSTFGRLSEQEEDGSMQVYEKLFTRLCVARPELHIYASGAECKFDSHHYEGSIVARAAESKDLSLCFLMPDRPPSTSVRKFELPTRTYIASTDKRDVVDKQEM